MDHERGLISALQEGRYRASSDAVHSHVYRPTDPRNKLYLPPEILHLLLVLDDSLA